MSFPVAKDLLVQAKQLQDSKGNPFHRATSGELEIYMTNRLILRKACEKKKSYSVIATFNRQVVEVCSHITWSPRWGLTWMSSKRCGENSSNSQDQFCLSMARTSSSTVFPSTVLLLSTLSMKQRIDLLE